MLFKIIYDKIELFNEDKQLVEELDNHILEQL